MTLEKAIEGLDHLLNPTYFLISENERDAVRLGIEALKLTETMRQVYAHPELLLLPGETVGKGDK